jgi:hypothetical protein
MQQQEVVEGEQAEQGCGQRPNRETRLRSGLLQGDRGGRFRHAASAIFF